MWYALCTFPDDRILRQERNEFVYRLDNVPKVRNELRKKVSKQSYFKF